jgi:glutamyl-tRNA(Gln) amidotransferase subunit E
MTELDYRKLGLRCGIEIHQQLDTRKLFCDCDSSMQEQEGGSVVRKLRAVAGELGEVDAAALHEVLRGKEFHYRVYPGESCLVETDSEPPHSLNDEALDISLVVSTMLNCEVPDEVHFMRKQVIDGSNTTGFQRTAMLGLNGWLKTSLGRVGITNVCLEEDAAQILGREENRITYGLNRLCVPLVEIGTSPGIRTPEHAREVAAKIGMILRSTGRVKRGIGTIRQDVNVSITDGARVEIKGAQELNLIPRLVRNEVLRQSSLVDIRNRLIAGGFRPVRKVLIEKVTRIFSDSEHPVTRGKKTYAIKIPGLAGFLRQKLTPTRTLGNEIANYVKVRIGARGFIHSDEDISRYGLNPHFQKLEKHMKAGKGDTLIIVSGDEEHCEKTLKAIIERVNMLLDGVPRETRRALENGDSEYMRPLPGAARMYPETDILPVSIGRARLGRIRRNLPELIEERIMRFVLKHGIGQEIAGQVVHSGHADLFEYGTSLKIDPTFLAWMLTSGLSQLKARDSAPVENLTGPMLKEAMKAMEGKSMSKESVLELLRELSHHPEKDPASLIRGEAMAPAELGRIISKVISENRDALRKHNPEKILMGLVMREVRGRVPGSEVARALAKELRKGRSLRT